MGNIQTSFLVLTLFLFGLGFLGVYGYKVSQKTAEDYFTASLEDLHGRISTAEFSKKEITPSDLNLLAPNVRFSYTVTQMDRRSGREYVSKISLSGPAIWTKKDFEQAKKSYEKLFPEELFKF